MNKRKAKRLQRFRREASKPKPKEVIVDLNNLASYVEFLTKPTDAEIKSTKRILAQILKGV